MTPLCLFIFYFYSLLIFLNLKLYFFEFISKVAQIIIKVSIITFYFIIYPLILLIILYFWLHMILYFLQFLFSEVKSSGGEDVFAFGLEPMLEIVSIPNFIVVVSPALFVIIE